MKSLNMYNMKAQWLYVCVHAWADICYRDEHSNVCFFGHDIIWLHEEAPGATPLIAEWWHVYFSVNSRSVSQWDSFSLHWVLSVK